MRGRETQRAGEKRDREKKEEEEGVDTHIRKFGQYSEIYLELPSSWCKGRLA